MVAVTPLSSMLIPSEESSGVNSLIMDLITLE